LARSRERRGRSYAQIDAVAQGRVWTGKQALEQGLVDQLGGLDAAIALAKQKAGLPALAAGGARRPARSAGTLDVLTERPGRAGRGALAARRCAGPVAVRHACAARRLGASTFEVRVR